MPAIDTYHHHSTFLTAPHIWTFLLSAFSGIFFHCIYHTPTTTHFLSAAWQHAQMAPSSFHLLAISLYACARTATRRHALATTLDGQVTLLAILALTFLFSRLSLSSTDTITRCRLPRALNRLGLSPALGHRRAACAAQNLPGTVNTYCHSPWPPSTCALRTTGPSPLPDEFCLLFRLPLPQAWLGPLLGGTLLPAPPRLSIPYSSRQRLGAAWYNMARTPCFSYNIPRNLVRATT